VSTVFAIISSYAFGVLTDRKGSRYCMRLTLNLWLLTLCLAVLAFTPRLLWIVGPLAGVCFGAIWVCSRTLIIEMFPAGMIAEVFGVFGLVGRASAIVGPGVWALTTWSFAGSRLGYRLAVLTLIAYMAGAAGLFIKVPEPGSRGQGELPS
jgi:UMF1 family MFS transporter